MRPDMPLAEDGALYLARLTGEIQDRQLGAAFIEALVDVVLGSESLEQLRTQGIDSASIWAISGAATANRITAAERVLGIQKTKSDQ